jgi:hypothetical protein
MKEHKCLHCPHKIRSKYVVCLTCRKKKSVWAKKNRKKINRAERIWRNKNPLKVQANKKRYRKKHLEKVKTQIRNLHKINGVRYRYNRWRIWIKNKYGLTEEKFISILKKQKGLCAICKSLQLCGKRKKLYLDHCHKTNKFRGLICFRCNTMLGMALDNIKILKAAIKYLRRQRAIQISF